MPNPRKSKTELITAMEAGRRLRISRNGVINRLARGRYEKEEHGGVLFVVVDERFLADVQAAEAAAEQERAATEQAVA